jgi:hypothetical protein
MLEKINLEKKYSLSFSRIKSRILYKMKLLKPFARLLKVSKLL